MRRWRRRLRSAAGAREDDLLAANARDLADAAGQDFNGAFVDRLTLSPERIEAMAAGAGGRIAALPDPVGSVAAEWDRPNGLRISRVRTPLGVIGIIYESRPNVTADAGALCLKSGNAAILRGGRESFHTSRIIGDCLRHGLGAAGLPEDAVQLVPTTDRAAVGAMLRMNRHIDIIVPRGGKGLIARVQEESRVPVIAHLDGNCHVYVDAAADLEMARRVTVNAKTRRPGICGAAETLLVDRQAHNSHLAPIVSDLLEAGVEIRGDTATQAIDKRIVAATEEDWDTEYLDWIMAVKLVDGVERRHRPYRAPRQQPYRLDRYGGRYGRGEIPRRRGQRHRAVERLDPVRRRRRVRHGRGDRHLHRQAARPRPGRPGAAHQLQICRARRRADPALTVWTPSAPGAFAAAASACSAARSISGP